MSKSYFIIPIFVPHRGCPNDCVFCNQMKITGLSTDITKEDVDLTIRDYLNTIPNENATIEVAFYGGSFTGIEVKIQKELLSVASNYKKKNLIHKIRLSTRPDYIDEDKLRVLRNYDVDIIELGVQSLDDEVLRNSHRGHSKKDVYDAVDLINKYNFDLGLQMMVGLVGDTKNKSLKTAIEIIGLNPSFVRIYPTLVVKDTILEKLYLEDKYRPLSLDDSIDICCDLLMLFKYNNIPVIRLGLQPTDNISLSKDIVAGPFHPSFRQLVESRIVLIILEDFLNNIDKDFEILSVFANKKEISNVVGQKSFNVKYLNMKYSLKLKISQSELPEDVIIIKGEEEYIISKKSYIKKYLTTNNLI